MSAAQLQGVSAGQMTTPNQAAISALTRDYGQAVPAESDLLTQMTLKELAKDEPNLQGLTMGLNKQLMYLNQAGRILHGDGLIQHMSPGQQTHIQQLFGSDFRGQVQLAEVLKQQAKEQRAKTLLAPAVASMLGREMALKAPGGVHIQARGAFKKLRSLNMAAMMDG